MIEQITVPATCPGQHVRHNGEVNISRFVMGWFLHLEFRCDRCPVKVYNQILDKAPPLVRDTQGRELRIVMKAR